MGRGRGGADEIFYGEELAQGAEDDAESKREDTEVLWRLFERLQSTPRDSLTLKPAPDGVFLISSSESFPLFESQKYGPDGFMALELVQGPDGKGLVETRVYDKLIGQEGIGYHTIYSGRSLRKAYEAGAALSVRWAVEDPGQANLSAYFDITWLHLRDSLDLLVERASRS